MGDIAMKEHQKIRSALVSFMSEKWRKQGKRIVGRNYNDYLENLRMEEEGTWATGNEISVTAVLLGTTIMVLTQGMERHKWVTHNPSTLKGKGCPKQRIYLINECEHYPTLVIQLFLPGQIIAKDFSIIFNFALAIFLPRRTTKSP